MYLARISRYLDGWLRLSKVPKTYEGLIDFILRDQFLEVCNRELYQNLSSKKLATAKDVAEDADLFAKTRGGPKYVVNRSNKDRSYKPYEVQSRSQTSNRSLGNSSQGSNFSMNRGSSFGGNRNANSGVSRGRGSQNFGVLKCSNCGRTGHTAFFCRSPKYGQSASAADTENTEQRHLSNKDSCKRDQEPSDRGRNRSRARSRFGLVRLNAVFQQYFSYTNPVLRK